MSSGGHEAKKRVTKKRSKKFKKYWAKPGPVPFILPDEIMLLRGMMSQLQRKMNKASRLENTEDTTGCCNGYLDWFATCDGENEGSSVWTDSSSKSKDEPLYLL